MNHDEVQVLLDTQRKIFIDVIDRLDRKHAESCKTFERRINDLISSLEFTQANVDEITKKMKSLEQVNQHLTSSTTRITNETKDIRNDVRKNEDRQDYLDDQSRRNNLRVCGVPEDPGENWEQCQRKLSNILRDRLNITPNFDRVHRIGRLSSQRQPRDIIARCSTYADRENIFRNRRKLKGTQVFINEDFCPGTLAARKSQMEDFFTARKAGKHVFFNYRTLVVRDPRHGLGNISGGQTQPDHQPRTSSPRTPPRQRSLHITSTCPPSPRLSLPIMPPNPQHPPDLASLQAFPGIPQPQTEGTPPEASTTSGNEVITDDSTVNIVPEESEDAGARPLLRSLPSTEDTQTRTRKQTNFYKP